MLLPLRQDPAPVAQRARPSALSAGCASLFFPGSGQVWQRRYVTGFVHFVTCAAFGVAGFRFGGGWWSVGALLVNGWSGIEAAWWARGSGEDTEPPPTESAEATEFPSKD